MQYIINIRAAVVHLSSLSRHKMNVYLWCVPMYMFRHQPPHTDPVGCWNDRCFERRPQCETNNKPVISLGCHNVKIILTSTIRSIASLCGRAGVVGVVRALSTFERAVLSGPSVLGPWRTCVNIELSASVPLLRPCLVPLLDAEMFYARRQERRSNS